MKTNKIVFMGCGHMGSSLLNAWLENNSVAAEDVLVMEQSADIRKDLKEQGIESCDCVCCAPDIKAKLIVIAVKPNAVGNALEDAKAFMDKGTIILSVAAGKTLKFIEDICPKQPVIRMMPNMSVSVGLGVSALLAGSKAKKVDKDFCFKLMVPTGIVFWAGKDDDLHNVAAVSGSSPAYIYNAAAVLAKAAESYGFTKELAQEAAVNVLLGSVLLFANSRGSLADAIARVATKGGTTEAAVNMFNKNDALEKLFKKAMDACVKQSKALSK